jgi:hypothetical protein
MLTGELSGLDSMISPIYFHQRCITSCCGKLSKFLGSSAFKTPNKLLVVGSRKIEYSLMPVFFNNCSSSGHNSSCRFLYSSSKPGKRCILNAIRAMSSLGFGVWSLGFLISGLYGLTEIRTIFEVNPKPQTPNPKLFYLTNAVATPPSTFKTFPVDLFRRPPTKAKQAFAISSGSMISPNKVLFA